MKKTSERVVLVTGSSRGMGAATALLFAKSGFRVVISGRFIETLKEAEKKILERAPQSKIFSHVCDFSQPVMIHQLFNQIEKRWGPVEILINNAAIGYSMDLFSIDEKKWDDFFNTNVKGVFFASQEMLKRFRPGTSTGLIVNLTSLGGIQGTEKFKGLTPYVATKFAVTGLTEALAVEGKEYGVLVNAIAPGAVDTEMLKKAAPHLKTKMTAEDMAKIIFEFCQETLEKNQTARLLEVHSNL